MAKRRKNIAFKAWLYGLGAQQLAEQAGRLKEQQCSLIEQPCSLKRRDKRLKRVVSLEEEQKKLLQEKAKIQLSEELKELEYNSRSLGRSLELIKREALILQMDEVAKNVKEATKKLPFVSSEWDPKVLTLKLRVKLLGLAAQSKECPHKEELWDFYNKTLNEALAWGTPWQRLEIFEIGRKLPI